MDLLLACARRQPSPTQQARIRQLASSPGLDWDDLVHNALRHGLAPLVIANLRASKVELPDVLRQRLYAMELQNAGHMLANVRELLQMFEALREVGVLAVPYKGPVLALQLYGNPALRAFGDLDLLISRDHAAIARERLIERGYRPLHDLPAGALDFMLRSRYSETFEHPNGHAVELHWAFTNRDIALPLALEDLEPRLGSLQLGGCAVPVFATADLLIILCVHGAKHRWDRLEWLCGVAEAVRRSPDADWTALLHQASRLGVRRMVLLGLLLAAELLDAPVPRSVLVLARGDRAVARRVAEVPRILREPPIAEGALSLPVDRFQLGLRERWRDRVRFVTYRLINPSRPEEWRFITMGSRRIAVHGLLRPWQLTARVASAIVRRGERLRGGR